MKKVINYIKFIYNATDILEKIYLTFYITIIVACAILDKPIWGVLFAIILGQALEVICQKEINKEYEEKIDILIECQAMTFAYLKDAGIIKEKLK